MADSGHSHRLHVAVFPWLAFGHILPYMELSKAIARKGHKVSFLSTPKNLQRIPRIPVDLAPLIELVELHLPPVDGLQKGAEATSDLPPNRVPYLKKAFDGLGEQVDLFLQQASPKLNWVIHDFAHHWISSITNKVGVPCAYFSNYHSSFLVFFGPLSEMKNPTRTKAEDMTKPPKWITFPSTVAFKLHEARSLMNFSFENTESGVTDIARFSAVIQNCKVVAIRDCEEFSEKYLSNLQKIYGEKKVIPVGLLPPSLDETSDAGSSSSKMLQWLDKQEAGSVVYVAFGSEAKISIKNLHELALGLELSNVPFLWALRKPIGLSDEKSLLPEGFEERTTDRGLVVMSWVPQLRILAHASIGGFLTHCGLSSITESLYFKQPLISLPIFADQGLNSRVSVEKRIALEVERDEEDGSFTKEAVARAVGIVVVEEEGEEIRIKATEMSEIVTDRRLHDNCVDGFIQYLVDYKQQM